MKLKLFLYLAVLLCLAHTLALAGSINDTVWTKRFLHDVGTPIFFSGGEKLLVPSYDSTFIVDAKLGQTLKTFPSYGIGYNYHLLDDEQSYVYVSSKDTSFHIHEISTGKEIRNYRAGGYTFHGFTEYTQNGEYVILGIIPDMTNPPPPPVKGLGWLVMNLKTGEIKHRKLYPTKPNYLGVSVNKVFLTQTGDTAIVEVYRSYGDGQNHWTYTSNIILYNTATGDSLGVFPVMGYTLFQSNNNQHFAIVEDSILTTVNTKLQITHTKNFHNSEYHLSSISDDGNIYALARYMGERTMEVWDLERNEIIWKNNIGAIGLLLSPIKNQFIALYSNGIFYYKNKTTTSVSENFNSHNVLFPNPTTGELMLKFSLLHNGDVTYSFTDMKGSTAINGSFGYQEVGEHSQPIIVNMLPSGTYYLRLQTPDGITTYNVTITK